MIYHLIQYIIRHNLELNAQSLVITQIIHLILYTFSDNMKSNNYNISRRYNIQVRAILASLENYSNEFTTFTDSSIRWQMLVSRMAFFLFQEGYYPDSLKLYSECLEIRKRVLGPEHPSTLLSMEGLAAIYFDLGNFKQTLKV